MSSNTSVTLFAQETGAGLSTRFQPLVKAGIGQDLGDGIRNSYGIVSIKGGRWRVKYKGQETVLMDYSNPKFPQGYPVPSIDVVIVKANGYLNKQYYKGKFTEGSTAPPDCFSLDGKVPSSQVQIPIHPNCMMCPMNQFGSAITDDGKKQKACRDTKKLAVVPLVDLRNAGMGGAMLFRVPPSSLKDLSVLSDQLKGRGYPYNGVAIQLAFDTTVSHPKVTFQALRPLTDDEADVVIELFNSDGVEAVLADNSDLTPAEASQHAAQTAATTAAAAVQPVQAPQGAAAQAAMYTPPPPYQPGASIPPQVGAVAIQPFVGRDPNAAPPPPPTAFQAPVQASPTSLQLQPDTDEEDDEDDDSATNDIIQRNLPPVQTATPAATAAPAAPSNPFAPPPSAAGATTAPAPAPRRKRQAAVAPVGQPAGAAAPAAQPAPAAAPEQPPVISGQLDEDITNILNGLGGM